MSKKNKNFYRLHAWPKMTKKKQNFHHWYLWPKMLKIRHFHRCYPWPKMTKKNKLSPLVTLTKNDQEKKTFTIGILGRKC